MHAKKSVLPIQYTPRWPGPIQGYAINTARHYYGSLHVWHEFEDLLQEAYIVFLKCKRAYNGHVDNPRWFMALFKNALRNRFLNMIQHGPRYSYLEDNAEMMSTESIGTTSNEGYLYHLLSELPEELSDLAEQALLKQSCAAQRALKKHLEKWMVSEELPSLIHRRLKSVSVE